MDSSKGKQQGGKMPDKKSFNNPSNMKGPSGKWPGGQNKWSGSGGKKMSLPGKGSGGKFGGGQGYPGMGGSSQGGPMQGMMPGMMQGGGSGMGGQQGGMMPGMVQGMQGGMMPGMQQGGQGMMGGQQGGQMQGMMPMQQGQGPSGMPQGQVQIPIGGGPGGREQSYIENILRLNTGKPVTVYMSFEGREQEVFEGILREAGKDHIVISDGENGNWYLLLMIYLDYVVFDEEINYQYPFG